MMMLFKTQSISGNLKTIITKTRRIPSLKDTPAAATSPWNHNSSHVRTFHSVFREMWRKDRKLGGGLKRRVLVKGEDKKPKLCSPVVKNLFNKPAQIIPLGYLEKRRRNTLRVNGKDPDLRFPQSSSLFDASHRLAKPRSLFVQKTRKFFFFKFLLEKLMIGGKCKEDGWLRLLKTRRGCRLLLKSQYMRQLRSSMEKEELERTKKFGSQKICFARFFSEHNSIKRNLYRFKILSLVKKNQTRSQTRSLSRRILQNASLYSDSIYRSASPYQSQTQFPIKRRMKTMELPTQCLEVNYRTLKAGVLYDPNMGHIPHYSRLKDLNLLLWNGLRVS
ncbi:hypothetical protein CFOL_v3_02473 [Cephalotus follicularis]|uniref:Uncharacterized protein n=1 Tax=Cephalotus follicularis TaxID=3775 RepID=A0A1Q3ATG8_CEPFO|nr:hypothetical protein CFOL_v3_02473 [Cephalotus follicularis]